MILDKFYNESNLKPWVKLLIQALPGGSVIDTAISEFSDQYRVRKTRKFFDELSKGEIELTPEKIQNDDFLHAYYSVLYYVQRSRTDEKVARFAFLFRSLIEGKVDIQDHEDLVKILDELTDREMYVLIKKREFEKIYTNDHPEIKLYMKRSAITEINPKQILIVYWAKFRGVVLHDLCMEIDQFNPMLIRLQRTGCYSVLKGYYDQSTEEDGNTTPLFHKLYELIADPQCGPV
jgi:hypothetical protein